MSIVLGYSKSHSLVELEPGKVYMDDTTGYIYLIAKNNTTGVTLINIETGGIVGYSQISPDTRFMPVTIKLDDEVNSWW